MYWTDFGQQPMIGSANLDGSELKALADSGIVSPNCLTVDFATNDVYWTDDKTSTIEKVRKQKLLSEYFVISFMRNMQ